MLPHIFRRARLRRLLVFAALSAVPLCGCADDGGVTVDDRVRYEPGFFGSPFPDDARLTDGKVDLADFPNPDDVKLVADAVGLLHGRATGFSTTAGMFFRWLSPASAPGELRLAPTNAVLPLGEYTPPGDEPLAVALPFQGAPLRPQTRHELDGVTGFTTWDPLAPMRTLTKAIHLQPLPQPVTAVVRREVFDEYCVYETRYDMPVFQDGKPPFSGKGGDIRVDAPVVHAHERARLFVTIPRRKMPGGGWPVAVFVRTGGGGDRPMIDRGVRDAQGNVAIPGTGPALHFARAGFAGAQIDGPHGGLRNVTGGDEQLLIFNIGNLAAMRGNLLQSAAELVLLPLMLTQLHIDVSTCPGASADAGKVRLNIGQTALMGHSMGATIAPLVAPFSTHYDALILSGAGGSWLENILYKQKPLNVKPLAEALLNYTKDGRVLTRWDPVLSLVQWAGEIADPPVFARAVTDGWVQRPAPHVLMLQGVVDRYIMPPIANATSVAYRLDFAGQSLDVDHAETKDMLSAKDALAKHAGTAVVAFPVKGNRDDGERTAVVTQHAEDGVEDGHEVVFQLDAPKKQYACFLKTLRGGVPVLIGPDGSCP